MKRVIPRCTPSSLCAVSGPQSAVFIAAQAIKGGVAGGVDGGGTAPRRDQAVAHTRIEHAQAIGIGSLRKQRTLQNGQQVNQTQRGDSEISGRLQGGTFSAGRVGSDHQGRLKRLQQASQRAQGQKALATVLRIGVGSSIQTQLVFQIGVTQAQVGDGLGRVCGGHTQATRQTFAMLDSALLHLGWVQRQNVLKTQNLQTRHRACQWRGGGQRQKHGPRQA